MIDQKRCGPRLFRMRGVLSGTTTPTQAVGALGDRAWNTMKVIADAKRAVAEKRQAAKEAEKKNGKNKKAAAAAAARGCAQNKPRHSTESETTTPRGSGGEDNYDGGGGSGLGNDSRVSSSSSSSSGGDDGHGSEAPRVGDQQHHHHYHSYHENHTHVHHHKHYHHHGQSGSSLSSPNLLQESHLPPASGATGLVTPPETAPLGPSAVLPPPLPPHLPNISSGASQAANQGAGGVATAVISAGVGGVDTAVIPVGLGSGTPYIPSISTFLVANEGTNTTTGPSNTLRLHFHSPPSSRFLVVPHSTLANTRPSPKMRLTPSSNSSAESHADDPLKDSHTDSSSNDTTPQSSQSAVSNDFAVIFDDDFPLPEEEHGGGGGGGGEEVMVPAADDLPGASAGFIPHVGGQPTWVPQFVPGAPPPWAIVRQSHIVGVQPGVPSFNQPGVPADGPHEAAAHAGLNYSPQDSAGNESHDAETTPADSDTDQAHPQTSPRRRQIEEWAAGVQRDDTEEADQGEHVAAAVAPMTIRESTPASPAASSFKQQHSAPASAATPSTPTRSLTDAAAASVHAHSDRGLRTAPGWRLMKFSFSAPALLHRRHALSAAEGEEAEGAGAVTAALGAGAVADLDAAVSKADSMRVHLAGSDEGSDGGEARRVV
jgi:hypothetical protein